jgi:hypothetical protein
MLFIHLQVLGSATKKANLFVARFDSPLNKGGEKALFPLP